MQATPIDLLKEREPIDFWETRQIPTIGRIAGVSKAFLVTPGFNRGVTTLRYRCAGPQRVVDIDGANLHRP